MLASAFFPPLTDTDTDTLSGAVDGAGAARTTDPVVDSDSLFVVSVAVTVKEYVPAVPEGAERANVTDAVAPGASDAVEVGENDFDQPLGTAADIANADAAHVEALLFLTVTLNDVVVTAAKERLGGSVVQVVVPGVVVPPGAASMTEPVVDADRLFVVSVAVTVNE
jgi:hypothetical protein